jgi:hypothetical protein
MKFVQLPVGNGEVVYINPLAVRMVTPAAKGHCEFAHDHGIGVSEAAVDVVHKLDQAQLVFSERGPEWGSAVIAA